LNERVIDFEYVATCETRAVICAISWCSHSTYVCMYVRMYVMIHILFKIKLKVS
jgi:hypothetical protein